VHEHHAGPNDIHSVSFIQLMRKSVTVYPASLFRNSQICRLSRSCSTIKDSVHSAPHKGDKNSADGSSVRIRNCGECKIERLVLVRDEVPG